MTDQNVNYTRTQTILKTKFLKYYLESLSWKQHIDKPG